MYNITAAHNSEQLLVQSQCVESVARGTMKEGSKKRTTEERSWMNHRGCTLGKEL